MRLKVNGTSVIAQGQTLGPDPRAAGECPSDQHCRKRCLLKMRCRWPILRANVRQNAQTNLSGCRFYIDRTFGRDRRDCCIGRAAAAGNGAGEEKGRQISCINSVRQQTLSVLIYADDHAGVLPPTAYMDAFGREIDWPQLLDPYLNNTAKIHLCPTDRSSKLNSDGLNELAFVDLTDPDHTAPVRVTAFRMPSTTIMQGDLGTEDDFKTPRPDTLKLVAPGSTLNDEQDARPSIRHSGRCDLGYMDGHSGHPKLKQFYTGQNPTNRWFIP